jgi:hypothetical protein
VVAGTVSVVEVAAVVVVVEKSSVVEVTGSDVVVVELIGGSGIVMSVVELGGSSTELVGVSSVVLVEVSWARPDPFAAKPTSSSDSDTANPRPLSPWITAAG